MCTAIGKVEQVGAWSSPYIYGTYSAGVLAEPVWVCYTRDMRRTFLTLVFALATCVGGGWQPLDAQEPEPEANPAVLGFHLIDNRDANMPPLGLTPENRIKPGEYINIPEDYPLLIDRPLDLLVETRADVTMIMTTIRNDARNWEYTSTDSNRWPGPLTFNRGWSSHGLMRSCGPLTVTVTPFVVDGWFREMLDPTEPFRFMIRECVEEETETTSSHANIQSKCAGIYYGFQGENAWVRTNGLGTVHAASWYKDDAHRESPDWKLVTDEVKIIMEEEEYLLIYRTGPNENSNCADVQKRP